MILASVILIIKDIAIPLSEVGLPRLDNSAGPPHPHHIGCFCIVFEYVTALGDRNQAAFRSDTSTSGSKEIIRNESTFV